MFDKLIEKVKAQPKTIVFTEGTDARILEAASKLLAEKLMGVILVGKADEVKAAAAAKGFVIDGEDATDIGLVQMVEGSDKPVYNMSGQKVQKAQRGIYIINGKKVVIK